MKSCENSYKPCVPQWVNMQISKDVDQLNSKKIDSPI